MDLRNTYFVGLTSIDVTVEGKWSEKPSSRDWKGIVIADEPIVAISFIKSSGICQWVKSERDKQPPDIRCVLFPYDDNGLDIQVNFGVGKSNRICRTLVPTASYRPSIPDKKVFKTACIHHFATIDGNPFIELFILFIAKADITSSRNTLWRIRESLVQSIPEPWGQWLTHSRTGQFNV